ncbi:tRNA pseudouridine(38-40) synthase TruA [Candidatus Bandiella euplotis]|uniref:tRNA pseudouridine synthase A n=1 Tax=Candidatus Bandiella euplotis TaxID=1664265 RepID=A0ABZ0UKL0_9RICK|nr:tRNA pseudouridine(38-40) synthase TruA [Candidatus Bandiella woodruffii]WPX96017.1 tRNA pseudouridine synthase A [Candidatus Bandiella woodruffii]
MPRYKLVIEYDGTNFHGWQSQKNAITIQGELEIAISNLLKIEVKVQGASRTDSGVHAYGQVAHFDVEKSYDIYRMQNGINYYLRPHKICIVAIEKVDDEFHARFSAKHKQYVYQIINRTAPTVLFENKAWHIKEQLNIYKMQEAAGHLIGTHDFSSFRATGCQAQSPIKTLDSVQIEKVDDQISIKLTAKSFLYNQVRIMVGTLRDFGQEKWSPSHMKAILESKTRALAGQTAPSHGLHLKKIDYLHSPLIISQTISN